jgi:hypothetical protein
MDDPGARRHCRGRGLQASASPVAAPPVRLVRSPMHRRASSTGAVAVTYESARQEITPRFVTPHTRPQGSLVCLLNSATPTARRRLTSPRPSLGLCRGCPWIAQHRRALGASLSPAGMLYLVCCTADRRFNSKVDAIGRAPSYVRTCLYKGALIDICVRIVALYVEQYPSASLENKPSSQLFYRAALRCFQNLHHLYIGT